MKRIFILGLSAFILLSFSGCGDTHNFSSAVHSNDHLPPVSPNSFVYFESVGNPTKHYEVTNRTVKNVGHVISKTNLATNGPAAWTSSDNIVAVYSISGIDMNQEVALKLSDGSYVEADAIGNKKP